MKLARNYEEILFENIRLELNMTIQQSKEFIVNKTGQSDFLISENTGDLLNPLWKMQDHHRTRIAKLLTNLSLINFMFN